MNRNPSNSPRIISTNISGPGNHASQPEGRKKWLYNFGDFVEGLTLELYAETAEEEDYDGHQSMK